MGTLDESPGEFQHRKGQEDGSSGALFGTSGDCTTEKYREGFDAGRFDYDKKRFGETWARVAKDERDYVRRISSERSPRAEAQPPHSDGKRDKDDRSRSRRKNGCQSDEVDESIAEFLRYVAIVITGLGAIAYIHYRIDDQPKNAVAKKYKLDARRLVDRIHWGTRLSGLASDRNTDELAESALACLRPTPKGEERENLKKLAKTLNGGKRQASFNDVCKRGDDVWIGGSCHKGQYGIVCYSPDSGKTWFAQWSSDPTQPAYDGVPQEIRFLDKNRGYFRTDKGKVFRTESGGRDWQQEKAASRLQLYNYRIELLRSGGSGVRARLVIRP